MKSGPTLNGATTWPACRSAPIKPVATVVFPLPEAGAATTTAGGVLVPPPAASVRKPGPRHGVSAGDTHARGKRGSPLDALLALTTDIHRMLDLRPLGDPIGGVDQPRRGVASGDHH